MAVIPLRQVMKVEEEGGRGLGLPKANLIVVPPWLSPSGLGGVAGIKMDPLSCSGVAALTFPRLVG